MLSLLWLHDVHSGAEGSNVCKPWGGTKTNEKDHGDK